MDVAQEELRSDKYRYRTKSKMSADSNMKLMDPAPRRKSIDSLSGAAKLYRMRPRMPRDSFITENCWETSNVQFPPPVAKQEVSSSLLTANRTSLSIHSLEEGRDQ